MNKQVQDKVSLSAAAQKSLSNLQIAAQILADSKFFGKGVRQPAHSPASPTEVPGAAPPTSTSLGGTAPKTTPTTQTLDASDVISLAAEKPEQVITEVLTAAQAALNDSAGFYQSTSEPLGSAVLDLLTANLSADQLASFTAAYSSKSLNIQNAADVPGWRSSGQVVLTGQSENFGPSETGDGPTGFAQPPEGINYASVNFGVGQLYVSWPK